jgi:hypothetical protein
MFKQWVWGAREFNLGRSCIILGALIFYNFGALVKYWRARDNFWGVRAWGALVLGRSVCNPKKLVFDKTKGHFILFHFLIFDFSVYVAD